MKVSKDKTKISAPLHIGFLVFYDFLVF